MSGGRVPFGEEAPFQYESNSEQFYKYTLKKTKEGLPPQ